MVKWECHVLQIRNMADKDFTDFLNDRGDEGWEFVQRGEKDGYNREYDRCIFKRPLPAD